MGKYRYAVLLDAGSSGTRVHIYRWLKTSVARKSSDKEELLQLPVVKTKSKKWTKKVQPGISSYADKVDQVGSEHLRELFQFAEDVVPKSELRDTPIFLMATAGMRLLQEQTQQDMLAEACSYAQAHTPFKIASCNEHFQVITGETEGLLGWIASNYLVKGFYEPVGHKHESYHHTFGFLDMGGASAQIAFVPNKDESEKHANDLKLLRMRTIDGVNIEYRVFVTTFLGYGANEARRRYVAQLDESKAEETGRVGLDPCLPAGLEVTPQGRIIKPGSPEAKGEEPYLRGTGDFSECLATTVNLLDKNAECVDEPCLFHGVHVPGIDFDINHFIGVSNFWHGTHEIFEMGHKDRSYDLATYQRRVDEFCRSDWTDIQGKLAHEAWGDGVEEESAAEACFKAAWIINMLHEGIGVPRVGLESDDKVAGEDGTKAVLENADNFLEPFQAVNKVDDVEVAWTLGKVILYASSQIPPDGGEMALEVGFGSNVPDATDFVRGGGLPDYASGDWSADDENDDEEDEDEHRPFKTTLNDLREKLLNSEARGPGYAMFGIIVVVVALLLMGKQRRHNLARKLMPWAVDRKKYIRLEEDLEAAGSGGIRPGRNGSVGPSRAGDNEEVLVDPGEFELGDVVHSAGPSSEDGSSTGRRSPSGFQSSRRRGGKLV